jgi:LAO/AO transport system kinase
MDIKTIARNISLIENEAAGYEDILRSLPVTNKPVIGITGAPGAGKSTISDALISNCINNNLKVAVICVDPSSPFNMGALLGDRIRMNKWYNNPNVYIRSLATRGSLGGLHPKIIEITDLLKASLFDIVIVETVGVGQSEIEIAGLADVTLVVLVPEGGDEIQTMKAGIMEIANIFIVNKADRPGADAYIKNLHLMFTASHLPNDKTIPVIKTIATNNTGVDEVYKTIWQQLLLPANNKKRIWLLAQKAYQLIQAKRMKNIDKQLLLHKLTLALNDKKFNLYSFIENF